jgi:murein L,D-transpeptidase YcbB/YkuD
MRNRLLALVAAGMLAAPADAPAQNAASSLRLDLNIPTSRLVVWEGDRIVKAYPISVGTVGHDTPTGEFTISRAEWNPWWTPPEREWAKNDKKTPPGPNNPMGRVKLFFAPYYFIHGTPHEKDLGRPASHGCVRMRNTDVIELGKMLHTHGRAAVPPTAVAKILANSSQTRVVGFPDRIPLRIRYEPVVIEGGELRIYPDVYARKSVHTEGVYQALLAAGYGVDGIDRNAIRAVLKRAEASKTRPFVVPVEQAFGGALTRSAAAR